MSNIEFFWSTGDFLSNFYPATFKIADRTYHSSEQAYMHAKALHFDDCASANAIMETTTPRQAKNLGRRVEDYDDKLWGKVKEIYMYGVCMAKFSQNPELLKLLLATGDKILAEASPYDQCWGIGLSKDHKDAQDPKLWRGDNLLGKVLMQVREDLK